MKSDDNKHGGELFNSPSVSTFTTALDSHNIPLRWLKSVPFFSIFDEETHSSKLSASE